MRPSTGRQIGGPIAECSLHNNGQVGESLPWSFVRCCVQSIAWLQSVSVATPSAYMVDEDAQGVLLYLEATL